MKQCQASTTGRTLLALAASVLLAPLALGASTYKVLHNFGGPNDGSVPTGSLLIDGNGRLYGNTGAGGIGICEYGCGVTFALIPGSGGEWTEEILYEFSGANGVAFPEGSLIGNDRHLYGTMSGAVIGEAAIFELSPGSSGLILTPIYNQGFSVGLVLDKAGNIYGSIGKGDLGAGAIGELSPSASGWTYKQLYSFCSPEGGCPDGDGTDWPMSWDAQGNLYSTTLYGGNSTYPYCPGSAGCGVAYQLAANPDGTWTYHVMHRFASSATDGQSPLGGMIVDRFGNAYGTTTVGGPACGFPGCGTVFKLSPLAAAPWFWRETIIYDFPAVPICSQGCAPGYNMVFDQAGNIYGMAGGGSNVCTGTCGVIFKLAPQPNGQWTYSIVHAFDGEDGSEPIGLTIDAHGNLFGVTRTGGTYRTGVAFEITP